MLRVPAAALVHACMYMQYGAWRAWARDALACSLAARLAGMRGGPACSRRRPAAPSEPLIEAAATHARSLCMHARTLCMHGWTRAQRASRVKDCLCPLLSACLAGHGADDTCQGTIKDAVFNGKPTSAVYYERPSWGGKTGFIAKITPLALNFDKVRPPRAAPRRAARARRHTCTKWNMKKRAAC